MKSNIWKRAALATVLVAGGAGMVTVATGGPAGADHAIARATLFNGANPPAEVGQVVFLGRGRHADRVEISLALPTGAPGLGAFHGLHVHTVGLCTAPFTSAGRHWNLTPGATHGNHTGDLPSILIAEDGTASATFETPRFDISDLFDDNGSAVVLHAGVDNFGNVPVEPGKYSDPDNWKNSATGTNNTGDAGGRYACGIVGR